MLRLFRVLDIGDKQENNLPNSEFCLVHDVKAVNAWCWHDSYTITAMAYQSG